MTKLAYLIAQEEGFFRSGSLPQRRHNPGDLRHGPHCSHKGIDPNAIGVEPCDEAGWEDLERQLHLEAERGKTLRSFVWTYAPPLENNPSQYLNFLTRGLNMDADTLLKEVLKLKHIPESKLNDKS